MHDGLYEVKHYIWVCTQCVELGIPGWYFADETSDFHGPFDTQADAEYEFDQYCGWLDGKRTNAD